MASQEPTNSSLPPEPRRFVGLRAAAETSSSPTSTSSSALVPSLTPKRIIRQTIPDSLLENVNLNRAISVLPSNYNFEIHKTIWRIQQAKARRIALQFPEGLQMYACTIADILEAFIDPIPASDKAPVRCILLGDVTYGACCVDDYSATALGCDFLVHYGHSCLVPVDVSLIPCMYVFVDILVDLDHFVDTVRLNFADASTRLVLAGTIQFATSLAMARERLQSFYPSLRVPQCKPLSPGEVLGCTAPVLNEAADAILFLADGRFHLESLMIANPTIPAYRYDPYGRIFTKETYDQVGMRAVRRAAIEKASAVTKWGVILGTLGRQGNPRILDTLLACIKASKERTVTVFLMSEVQPAKLQRMGDIEAWAQIACPRLSIDWGEGFHVPVLTPYEAMAALGAIKPFWELHGDKDSGHGDGDAIPAYPMDYYAKEGGEWSSSYLRPKK